MPQLQNDTINSLEKRRLLEDYVQIKPLQLAYQNTEEGDALRKYLVDTCFPIMPTFMPETVQSSFPQEMLKEIKDLGFAKPREAGMESDGNVEEANHGTKKYRVD
jgi:hypothetical protein